MSAKKPFTCRGVRTRKRSAMVALVAMLASTFGGNNLFVPTVVHAQTAPVGKGFALDAGDLRFIYEQILVAQDHAAGGARSSGTLRTRLPGLRPAAAARPADRRRVASTTSCPARPISARPICRSRV